MAAAQRVRCDEALELYAGAKSLAEQVRVLKSVASTMVTGTCCEGSKYERGKYTTGAEIAVVDLPDPWN